MIINIINLIVKDWESLMQRKTVISCLFFCLISCLEGGCAPGRPQANSTPSRFQGTHLRIHCTYSALAQRLLRQAIVWQRVNQAQIEVTTDPRAAEEADILVVSASQLPRLIQANQVDPLPEHILAMGESFGWNNVLPVYRDRLLGWGRTSYAVPLVGDAPVFAYRLDLLNDRAHQDAYARKEERRLEPPQTWADLKRIARYFQSVGIAGLPKRSEDPLDQEDEFYTLAACYATRARSPDDVIPTDQRDRYFSFHRNLSSGQPLVNSPAFVHALGVLRDFEPIRSTDSSRGLEAFRKGQAVFCLIQAWAAADFQKNKESRIRDKVGFCPIPAGEGYFEPGATEMTPGLNPMLYLGSHCQVGAVRHDSPRKEAAFDLLAELAGKEISGQTVIDTRPGSSWAGGAIRYEQLEERFRWDSFDLDPEITSTFRQVIRENLLLKKVKNPCFCLRVPDQELRQKAMLTAILKVLNDREDPRKTLDAVAAEWNRLDSIEGLEKVRQQYRLSLGFQTQ